MRLTFANCEPSIPYERAVHNRTYAESLGLRTIRKAEAIGRRVAVVGGGPSIKDKLGELAEFDEIFAVNGMAQWLAKHGIEATMLALDGTPMIGRYCAGVKKAIVSVYCDRTVFDGLADADVSTFILGAGGDEGRIATCTTATVAPSVASLMGFKEAVFFGCESSFMLDETNVYRTLQPHENELWLSIRVGGEPFFTLVEFMLQAECLATVIREIPEVYGERSGGLLGAFVKHGVDYGVIALSPPLRNGMKNPDAVLESAREQSHTRIYPPLEVLAALRSTSTER